MSVVLRQHEVVSSDASLKGRQAPEDGHCLDAHGGPSDGGEPPTRRRRMRTLGPWFIVALIGFFYLASRLVTRDNKPAQAGPSAPPPVMTVATLRVTPRLLPRTLVVTGTVSARDPLSIGAEVSLRIDKVNVEEGDVVRRGQVLIELNASVLQAQLRQMQARLAQSQAGLTKAIQPNRPQELAGLQGALLQARANAQQERANLVQAQANFNNASKNDRRYQELVGQGFITTKEADDVRTELYKARGNLDAAKERLRAADFAVEQTRQKLDLGRVGGRAEDIEIARASTAEIEANIQQLQAQIAQTVVRAPDDGIITRRDAHVGDISSPGKVLFTMTRRSELELRAQVPEDELSHLRVGQTVRLVQTATTTVKATKGAPSLKSQTQVNGHIWLITPTVDASTRLGIARIAVPANSGLLPGMFVRAEIDGKPAMALVVPSRAVLGNTDDHFAFILDGHRARRRGVSVGARSGDDVELLGGLQEGDAVIVDGAGFLGDGDVVRVAETPQKAATAEVASPTPPAGKPQASNAAPADVAVPKS